MPACIGGHNSADEEWISFTVSVYDAALHYLIQFLTSFFIDLDVPNLVLHNILLDCFEIYLFRLANQISTQQVIILPFYFVLVILFFHFILFTIRVDLNLRPLEHVISSLHEGQELFQLIKLPLRPLKVEYLRRQHYLSVDYCLSIFVHFIVHFTGHITVCSDC